jgi:hypothetical protein
MFNNTEISLKEKLGQSQSVKFGINYVQNNQ